MIVLNDNNSYVEPTHLMVTLAVVTTWYSQIDACRWCRGAQMMEMEPVWCGGAQMWRWSLFDDDAAYRCLDDALCLHSLHWCMWLDPMPYDTLEPWVSLMMEMVAWWVSDMLMMTWFVDGDDIPCLDVMMTCTLMEMTYLALICWWRWHTLMTWWHTWCLGCWWGSLTLPKPI